MAKRSKERGNLDPLKISEASKSPVAYRIQADTEERAISQKLYRRSVIEEYTPPIITDDDQAPIKKFQSLEKDGSTTCDSLSRVDIISGQTISEENCEKCDAEENYLPPPPEFLLQRCSTEERDLPPPPPFELFTETVVEGTEKVLPEPTPQENSKGLNILYPHNDLTKTLPSKMISPRPGRKRVANKVVGELNELTAEGKNAIDSPGSPTQPDLPPQDYILDEFEERSMIEPGSYDDPKLKELINVLIEWINDELAGHRIIVKDIEEDLYDGQILQKLLEKLTEVKLDVVEVTQSEEGQKLKLKRVLDAANKVLGPNYWNQQKWNVDSIHSKNVVAILHLLVALARQFRAPIRLPENVAVNVVVVQKRNGMLHTRTVAEELTSTYDDLGLRIERDAFDTLFDHAPDKLQVVKKSLVTFVNKHLNRVNLEVTDLDTQFHDGVYLTLLMGLLESYFVPLYSFNLTPTTFDQKVHNVAFAFELMMDSGLPKPKARPEDLVNLDLKSTVRVLYDIFTKYKNLN